jgi:hypothetical protein
VAAKTYIDRMMDKCRHFTGVANNKCRAGIEYRSFNNGSDTGVLRVLPCFKEDKYPDTPKGVCAECSFPTREEAQEEMRKMRERQPSTITTLSALRGWSD